MRATTDYGYLDPPKAYAKRPRGRAPSSRLNLPGGGFPTVPETRRLAAIMFTDTVGYSTSAHADEAGTLARMREQEKLVRPVFREFHGREVKSTGDGFLVEFDSALRATECAIKIQERMHERNTRPGVVRMELRIGIHLGDVEQRLHDILGDAVNIAARVQTLADAGGICVSQQVFDQVSHKLVIPLESLGTRTLKGIAEPLPVYRIALPWKGAAVSTPPAGRHRLAVLPLANISPDPRDEYFADGLTEELIASLSRLRALRVIARTSVNQYKSTTKPLTQIGTELDVGSVIEGSVRKSGNRLRITLQLIDVPTQEHVWAETYDRELDDVFAVQAEVAEKTASALRLEFEGGTAAQGRRRPTENLTAYSLYLKGIHAARLPSFADYRESIRALEEAVRADPNFALAHGFLANMYTMLAGDEIAPREAFSRARELTARALALDPDSAVAHTALGNLLLQSEQDWTRAEREFRTAIGLNPSDVDAHFWYAALLRAVGRFPEAMDELRTALELDPLWWLPRDWLILVHIFAGRLDDALALADETLERFPDQAAAHVLRGWICLLLGLPRDAAQEAERAVGVDRPGDRLGLAGLRARLGDDSEARKLLAELTGPTRKSFVAPSTIAGLCLMLGEKSRAYEWLDRDLREGHRTLWSDYLYPWFDPVRSEPRFRSILSQLHLPAGA